MRQTEGCAVKTLKCIYPEEDARRLTFEDSQRLIREVG